MKKTSKFIMYILAAIFVGLILVAAYLNINFYLKAKNLFGANQSLKLTPVEVGLSPSKPNMTFEQEFNDLKIILPWENASELRSGDYIRLSSGSSYIKLSQINLTTESGAKGLFAEAQINKPSWMSDKNMAKWQKDGHDKNLMNEAMKITGLSVFSTYPSIINQINLLVIKNNIFSSDKITKIEHFKASGVEGYKLINSDASEPTKTVFYKDQNARFELTTNLKIGELDFILQNISFK